MNVIYKSTENRNPGDDLSYLGTRKVLFEHLGVHNQFFYDVMPLTYRETLRKLNRRKSINADLWHKNRNINIDLVVIAGTPIWRKKAAQLHDYVIEHKTPIIFIGVGTTSGKDVEHEVENVNPLWNCCKGFITRDKEALRIAELSDYHNGKVICCPSIFAFDVLEKLGTKTGIVFQASTRTQQQYDFIRDKMKTDDVLLIVHEIDDYEVLTKEFPEHNDKIVYSRNLDMLVRFYAVCDKVYSMRLHGVHFAFSLGIPTVCMKTKHPKARACWEISVETIDPEAVKESDLVSREKIIKIKKKKWAEYYNYLSKCQLKKERF